MTTDKDSHDDISCDNDRQDDSIHSNKYHDTEEESELCALPLLKPFTLSVTRLPTQRYFDTNVIVSITDSPGSSTCTCMSEEITLQNTVLSTIGTKVSQMKQFNLPIKKESDSFIGRKKKRAACVIISDDEKEGDDTYSQVTDSQKYIRNNEKVSPLYKVSNEKEEAKNKGRKGKAGRKRTKKSALPIGHKLTSKVFKPTIEKEDYQHLSLSSSEVSMQGDLRYTCKRNCLHDTEDVKEEEEEEEVEEEEKRELEIKTRNLKQNRLGRIRNNLAETVGDKHTSKSSKSANQMNEDDEHHQLCTSNCEGSFIKVKKKRVCVIISDEETEEDCEEENKKKSEQTEEKDEENMSRDDKEKNEMDKETAYGEGEKRPNKRLTRNKRKSPVQWRKASKSHQTTSNIISDEETEEDGEEENKKKSKQREGNDKEDIHVYEDNKEDKETNDGEVEEQPVLVNKKRVTRNKRKPPVQRKKASKLHQTTSNIISDKQLPQESQLVDKTLEKEGKAQEDEKEEGGSKEESFIAETPTQSTVKQQILSRLSSACYNALKRTEHTSYKRDLTTELSIASRGNPSSKPIEENSEEPIVEIKENNSSKEFGREIHNNPTQQLDENKGEELDENKGEELDENEREELDENNREELDKNKGEDHTILPSMIRKPSFNKRPSSRRSNFANQSRCMYM